MSKQILQGIKKGQIDISSLRLWFTRGLITKQTLEEGIHQVLLRDQ